ncbi:hypothetical protein [Rubellimicrobium aerolatum]|uniref:Uncharacterized protein n=1 Tax=Rubellimicrobium aerolatum TaxID=490979 RepID=A0ABW0SE39_9RHOB|nr:hypothetical protein [Rubellimicrobium aerolatum]MBP1806978.1 hypothetical protein [Rubellimicrobium aerolatum]
MVTEEGLRDLLGHGHRIVVVCLEPPFWKKSVWYGQWGIYSVASDGTSERILVSARSGPEGDKPRFFKTLNGLATFLHALGFRAIMVPMEPGARQSHNLKDHGPTQP